MGKKEINARALQAINQIIHDVPALTKGKFAEECGVGASKFSEILNGRMQVGADIMAVLVANYQINSFWLFTGEGDMFVKDVAHTEDFSLPTDRHVSSQDIPLYGIDAAAGLVAIFNSTAVEPADYLRIPNLPPVDGALYVRGEAMSPLLKSGDIVIFKKKAISLDSIIWGEIYILSFDIDGDAYTAVKFIRKSDTPGCIRLVSYNPDFAPKDIPLSSITALALVKASLAFHTME